MNSIRRYFPNFVTVDDEERVTVEFTTLEELLAIPWVKKFSKSPTFSRFSISATNQYTLMAEYENPREWRVVGFLKDPAALPIFEI
jgi:hypothetical protein